MKDFPQSTEDWDHIQVRVRSSAENWDLEVCPGFKLNQKSFNPTRPDHYGYILTQTQPDSQGPLLTVKKNHPVDAIHVQTQFQ